MQFLKKILLSCAGALKRSQASKIIFYHDISDAVVYTDMATSLCLFQQHVEKFLQSQLEAFKVLAIQISTPMASVVPGTS